ncbi:GGDEF domain-containing protein [bacterium]|nr:MAG: GGDEF domain-containing protein [bacterium]
MVMTASAPLHTLLPFGDLDGAVRATLAYLHRTLGFELWIFVRTEGRGSVIVESEGAVSALERGMAPDLPETLCARVTHGEGPLIAPRTSDGQAYAGVPILRGDGTLLGTICAVDTHPREIDCKEAESTLLLFGRLLSFIADRQLEVDEAERRAEHAEAEALTDPLTGVFNRRGWDRLLSGEDERCRRFGRSAHVFVLDLDEFKQINDTYGHAAGDRLLRQAAQATTRVLRRHDIVARTGGDEFAILAVESEPQQAERLRARLLAAFTAEGIAVSVGVAQRHTGATLRHAWEEADAAMYAMKNRRGGV